LFCLPTQLIFIRGSCNQINFLKLRIVPYFQFEPDIVIIGITEYIFHCWAHVRALLCTFHLDRADCTPFCASFTQTINSFLSFNYCRYLNWHFTISDINYVKISIRPYHLLEKITRQTDAYVLSWVIIINPRISSSLLSIALYQLLTSKRNTINESHFRTLVDECQ